MKLYFMKKSALDDIKANLRTLHHNYYRYDDNKWILDRFDYDPFVFLAEVPDFKLASLEGASAGQVELENCKIIYENLKFISPSQASDERLWAGLCNGVFYNYVRERWSYPTLTQNKTESDASAIESRFFVKGSGRGGLYRNTLAKCWWIGKHTYSSNDENHWHLLDSIGGNDFATKVNEIFYSNKFSANKVILRGITMDLDQYAKRDITIPTRPHIRSAVQYLNAIGGSSLLDTYSESEICEEVMHCINEIIYGKESILEYEEPDAEENTEEELE